MPNSMATPFSFLKGEEDEGVYQIHSLIKNFKQNAEALNAAIVAYVREENKCAYAKFVEELAWGIPMDLATLPEAKRQNILNWIKSNFDKKQISNTRNLGEVMQFAKRMLEDFKPGGNLPETDFQHDNHPPSDDSDPRVEGTDSNRGDSPSSFEHIVEADSCRDSPAATERNMKPKNSTIEQSMDPFFDAAADFDHIKEQPPTPDPNPPRRAERLEREKEDIDGKKKGASAPSANKTLYKDEPAVPPVEPARNPPPIDLHFPGPSCRPEPSRPIIFGTVSNADSKWVENVELGRLNERYGIRPLDRDSVFERARTTSESSMDVCYYKQKTADLKHQNIP